MIYRIISILSVSFLLAQSAQADKVSYRAVWHQDKNPSIHTAPLSLSAFLQTGQSLAKAGNVLIDAETAIINGRRVYAGLWTTGTGATFFTAPKSASAFREEINEKHSKGLRLVDFEVFRTNSGGRRYIGVWRNGTGKQILTGPMEKDAFFARGERLTADGLRLIDVEMERIDDTLLYHGLFRTGSGDNFITAPLRPRKFRNMRDKQVAAGRELIDMERVAGGPRGRFVGVWSSGPGKSRISNPRSFGKHFIFSQSQFNDEKHAVDFELNVIREGSSPRPSQPSGGDVDDAMADLPNNPANVAFNDNLKLRIIWSQDNDNPFTIELPRSAIPDYLPQDENGDYVLPDSYCGLEITRVNNIFWQIPGNDALQTPPFLQEDVSTLETDLFLGGVNFSGPFGACTGTQTAWNFPFPFTSNASDFMVQENLSLVIEIEQGSKLRFLPSDPPDAEHLSPDELFENSSEEKLKTLLEAFADLFEKGQDPNVIKLSCKQLIHLALL